MIFVAESLVDVSFMSFSSSEIVVAFSTVAWESALAWTNASRAFAIFSCCVASCCWKCSVYWRKHSRDVERKARHCAMRLDVARRASSKVSRALPSTLTAGCSALVSTFVSALASSATKFCSSGVKVSGLARSACWRSPSTSAPQATEPARMLMLLRWKWHVHPPDQSRVVVEEVQVAAVAHSSYPCLCLLLFQSPFWICVTSFWSCGGSVSGSWWDLVLPKELGWSWCQHM